MGIKKDILLSRKEKIAKAFKSLFLKAETTLPSFRKATNV